MRAFGSAGSFCCHRQVVKVGERVGLGPDADPTGSGEGGVLDLEQLPAIEMHLEARTGSNDAQCAPLPAGNLCRLPVSAALAFDGEIRPLTVLNLVEHDVVLKGIGANDVVVVLVLVTPDETSCLIHSS